MEDQGYLIHIGNQQVQHPKLLRCARLRLRFRSLSIFFPFLLSVVQFFVLSLVPLFVPLSFPLARPSIEDAVSCGPCASCRRCCGHQLPRAERLEFLLQLWRGAGTHWKGQHPSFLFSLYCVMPWGIAHVSGSECRIPAECCWGFFACIACGFAGLWYCSMCVQTGRQLDTF
jgi:hypothetical protein